jgi:hypothetical protein
MVMIVVIFFGAWLHTYQVFTARTLVAEVKISEIKTDANGKYMDVEYVPYQQESALAYLISPVEQDSSRVKPQTFKVYGDTVYISAPEVLFYDHLYLLNFQTIFKVAKLYGRYDLNNEAEQNRSEIAQEQGSYDLNGGIDQTWVTLRDQQTNFPYTSFIRTVQVSSAGQFGTDKQKIYQVYMNINGLEWQELKL